MGKSKIINFDGNHNTTGVEIPDGLITIGASEAYKLLEAFNIDWKNIKVPNAEKISKWNGAGVDFSSDGAEYEGNIADAIRDWADSSTSNKVDWINPYYDYLKENGLYEGEGNDKTYSLPDWASGKITGSEDIVDIINYLIWRVTALDYFTKNWDSRKTTANQYYVINRNDFPTLNGLNTSDLANSNSLLVPYSEEISGITNSKIFGYLVPYTNEPANTDDYGMTTNPFRPNDGQTIKTSGDFGITIITPSNGKITSNTQNGTGIVVLNNGSFVQEFRTLNNEKWYKYDLSLDIYNLLNKNYAGPAGVNGFFNIFKINYNSTGSNDNFIFDCFDSSTTTIGDNWSFYKFTQTSSTEGDVAYAEQDMKIPYQINKINNSLNALSWYHTITGTKDIVISHTPKTLKNKVNISTYSSSTVVEIPYALGRTDGYLDEYEIKLTPLFGDTYGIYPYFFIKYNNGNTTSIISSDTFDENNRQTKCEFSFASGSDQYTGDITLTYDAAGYLTKCAFHPCSKRNINTTLTICCLMYYNGTDRLRAINPMYFEFNVIMKADQKNYLWFNTSSDFVKYDLNYNGNGSPFEHHTVSNSALFRIPTSENNYSGYCDMIKQYEVGENGTPGNNESVPYAVSTVSYDDVIDNKVNIIQFKNLISSYCSTESSLKVTLLGAIKPTIESNYLSSWNGSAVNDPEDQYSPYIRYEEDLKIGKSNNKISGISDGTFYAYMGETKDIDISLGNYNGTTAISSSYIPENTDIDVDINISDETLDIDLKNYIINVLTTNNKTEFDGKIAKDINYSTAIYPNDNGLIRDNNEWHDADNEYYYLVYKIYSPDGVNKTFSYSACKAYFFLRVIRSKNNSNLAIQYQGSSSSELKYKIQSVENSPEYSTRTQVRQTIFLDRVLDSTSQQELLKYKGKQYWYLGMPIGSASEISETKDRIALVNTTTGEEYVKIFNVGDSYPSRTYTAPSIARQNPSTSVVYENPNAIVNAWTDSSDYATKLSSSSAIVGDYNSANGTTKSGAILFVNKLMTAVLDQNNISTGNYTKKNNLKTYNTVNVVLGIGNDNKYSRKGLNINENPFSFEIPIFPMEYDFSLGYWHADAATLVKLITSSVNPLELDAANAVAAGTTLSFSTQSSANIGKIIYILSNAFGIGASEGMEHQDKLEIKVDGNSIPYIEITDNFGYTFNAEVRILDSVGNAINGWFCPIELDQTTGTNISKFTVPNNSECAVMIYPDVYRTYANPTNTQTYKGLQIFPKDVTQESHMTLYVLNDDYSIYNPLKINIIYKVVAHNSGADVEQG